MYKNCDKHSLLLLHDICSTLISIEMMNIMIKTNMERKEFIWLTFLFQTLSQRKTKAETY